jgi:hypothetical protein
MLFSEEIALPFLRRIKGKAIPVTGRGGPYRVWRRQGSHIIRTISSLMPVKFTALRAGRPPFTAEKIPGTHFC